MRSSWLLLAGAALVGCATTGVQDAADPWYASPQPVHVHPGYGWGHPWYGPPHWRRPYYYPHRAAPPAARQPAPPPVAAPPAAPQPPRERNAHGRGDPPRGEGKRERDPAAWAERRHRDRDGDRVPDRRSRGGPPRQPEREQP